MRNFFRASRQVFRYRGTVALSVASSMMVAVLWGGNIGALYPIFEISLRGQSLQTWVEQEIAASDARVKEIGEKLGALESQEAGALRRSAQREIQHLRARQAAEVRALATYRRLRPYIQRFLPDDPFRTVVVIVVCLIVATAVKGAFVVVNMMATASAVQRTTADLQQQYFRHVTGMDLARYHQLGISQLMAHFNQATEGLRNGMMSLYGASIREPLKIVVCVIGAAWISWRLLAFTFLLAPLAALLLRLLARRIRDTMSLDLGDAVQLNRSVIEAVRGLPIVQAFTMQEYEVAKVDRACRQRMRKSIRVRLYIALTKPVMEVLGIVAISVALLCGMYLVLNQETQILGITLTDRPLSVSAMLVFFGLLVGMNEPARKLSDVFSRLQVGSAAADRIYSVLDMQPTIKDPADPRPLRRPLKQLVFDNVHFHYHPSQPVLQGVDLCIEQGQRIAIVGANGSGKTTLVNMILRFYDPTQGAVRWGDVDLRQASLLDLRGRVGLMTQQPMLMDDTVANNIRYGSPGATFEQVVAAAQLAQAHQFIESKLANGYDTVLGHDSHRLSGGQRQRIALARALLRKPEVLILDEATSQLDQQTERQIHESAAQFMQDCTTLIVTHRPLTLELADRIIVMDGGQIVDSGTRAELISRSRLFQQLLGPSQQRAA